MKKLAWFPLLIGCTDYQLKDFEFEASPGQDGNKPEAESDGDTDTATDEPPTDTQDIEEVEDDCTEELIGFDIDEFSTLQDAVNFSDGGWTSDAVVISFDDSILEPDQTWRVSAVEILIMISVDQYDYFTDGQEINIQLFDSNNPTVGPSWTMTQQVVRSQLTWSDYTLPFDAYHAGLFGEYQQKGAWLRFDTTTIVPLSGMTSTDFIAGVMWTPPGMVKVGYSNFNQDCNKNWSDYGSGWQLNSENPLYFGCSWPMLRVEIETTSPGDCE